MTPPGGAVDPAARFREAVRRALDEAPGPGPRGEGAERVNGVLRDAPDPDRREDLVERLLDDPPLAASVFQNVDLLYFDGHPDADAVSGLLLELLERAADREPGPDDLD